MSENKRKWEWFYVSETEDGKPAVFTGSQINKLLCHLPKPIEVGQRYPIMVPIKEKNGIGEVCLAELRVIERNYWTMLKNGHTRHKTRLVWDVYNQCRSYNLYQEKIT